MSMAITSDVQILRVRRQDDANLFVLLNISKSGSAQLDLQIAGTEGSAPFTGSIRQSRIRELRDKKYKGDDSEWEAALCTSLLQQPPTAEYAKELDGLETVAIVDPDEQIQIVIRKNIAGITQRLGAVPLNRDDDYAAVLFDWTGIAAQSSDTLRQQASNLQTSLNSQKDTIQQLNKQLEELVQAKKEHESAMLEKFAALLNTKKLKIRDQQRLLAGAKVDSKAAAQIQSARDPTKSRKAGGSRTSKRKAAESAAVDESESDAFDDMQVDEAPDADEDDRARLAETPDKSDLDETEDDEADDFDDLPTARPKPSQPGVGGKGKALDDVGKSKASQRRDSSEEEGPPPPKRNLPFNMKSISRNTADKPEDGENEGVKAKDEDDTDDDEL